jgi:hypothetical protein
MSGMIPPLPYMPSTYEQEQLYLYIFWLFKCKTSPSQSFYSPRTTQESADAHPNPVEDSNQQSHCWSKEFPYPL